MKYEEVARYSPEVWQGELKFLQSLVSGYVACGYTTFSLETR